MMNWIFSAPAFPKDSAKIEKIIRDNAGAYDEWMIETKNLIVPSSATISLQRGFFYETFLTLANFLPFLDINKFFVTKWGFGSIE